MRDFDECQPFVEHMFADHRRLAKDLLEIQALFDEKPSPASRRELVEQLVDLQHDLEHHFREEEEGGCLEEAVSHCPRLSANVRQIEEEHPQLLRRIKGVVAQLRDVDDAQGEQRAAVRFGVFVDRLRKHESSENWVMAQAFGSTWNLTNGANSV